MPETVTVSRCAGGNHVTLTVTGDKGQMRQIPMMWDDLISDEHPAVVLARLGLLTKDAALIHDARAAVKEAGAKDFTAVKTAVEGKAFDPVAAEAVKP